MIVAELISKYDLVAVPVVDSDGVCVGVIRLTTLSTSLCRAKASASGEKYERFLEKGDAVSHRHGTGHHYGQYRQ